MMKKREAAASHLERAADTAGSTLVAVAIVLFVFLLVLVLRGDTMDLGRLGVALGLLAVGLGSRAIGMTIRADRRYTDLAETLDTKLANLPEMMRGDYLTAFEVETVAAQSKELTQKRLDEDTERVGYARGELHQTDDGRWAIHWGGKHPL
jgi:hypothetical protein